MKAHAIFVIGIALKFMENFEAIPFPFPASRQNATDC